MFGVEAGQQDAGRVAILDVGGRDEQAVPVNQEMSLPPVDVLLRSASTCRVRRSLGAFTFWE